MNSINFDNPWLLLIVLPILALLFIPFFLSVRKDNRNPYNVISCILHVLIAVCIAVSAAGTSIKSALTETNVYVVADLSYSMEKNLEKVDGYINRLQKNLPIDTELGVVCFGGNGTHTVHTRLGERHKSIRNSVDDIDPNSTDIVSALDYTSKIFKSGVIKRIILITDGKDSNEADGMALKRKVNELHAAQIYVDAIYVDSNLTAEESEVQVSGVEYSDKVYIGQESTASVLLQSNVDTRATLTVELDGEVISSTPISVGKGLRSVPVALKTDEAGNYEYTVRVSDVKADGNKENNVCNFSLNVSDKPRVLFVSGQKADETLLQEIYGEEYAETVDFKYVKEDPEVPYTVGALSQYDEIALSDVKLEEIEHYAQFVENLDTVVNVLGKSLIGMGNLGIQDATDEENDVDAALMKLGRMLPVNYGSPISENKQFVIILDISHSMAQIGKLALAKRAAKQIVGLLGEKDEVIVVGFHSEGESIHLKTDASNAESVKAAIDKATTKNGTVLESGFMRAEEAIGTSAATQSTQFFLITDKEGKDFENAQQRAVRLKNEYGIKTSVLVVGSNTEDIPDGISQIATLTGGTSVGVLNSTVLSDAMFGDGGISETFKETVINRMSYVDLKQRYDSVLSGISSDYFQSIPAGGLGGYVGGYVTAKAKSTATTVITAKHGSANQKVDVPIYAHRIYGAGKTASFLSSFSGKWGAQWEKVGLSQQFFKNVFATNIPAQRVDTPFTVSVNRGTSSASLTVRPAELKAGAAVDVQLISPKGETQTIENVVFDSTAYNCSFSLLEKGEYTARVTYTYKGESYTLEKPLSVSYLAEYDEFTVFDASPLYKMLGEKGTVSEDGNLKIENDEKEVGVRIVYLTSPLLIVSVILFALDVIVRKVKWADIKNIFRKIRKKGVGA